MDVDYYAQPGPLTLLEADQVDLINNLGLDPLGLCRVAQNLFWPPDGPDSGGLSEAKLAERNTRPATRLLARALELDSSVLTRPRSRDRRVVGTCRHFSVMATALLRAAGVPARARCGFATYFKAPDLRPGAKVDHWVTEYWSTEEARWVRIDAEILGLGVIPAPEDLAPGQFLTGGEAWRLVRDGSEDPELFGVGGTDNWGPAEIRGNLLRDLAALAKVEMLPWDEWGPMRDSYDGRTGEDFDVIMDKLAVACDAADPAAVHRAYEDYAVPAVMLDDGR